MYLLIFNKAYLDAVPSLSPPP